MLKKGCIKMDGCMDDRHIEDEPGGGTPIHMVTLGVLPKRVVFLPFCTPGGQSVRKLSTPGGCQILNFKDWPKTERDMAI